MTLKDILRRHQIVPDAQSEESTKEALVVEIEAYQNKNRAIYVVSALLALGLFFLAASLLIQDVRAGASKLVPILSGSGLGMAALLEAMRRAARDWAQARLVLGVARVADEQRLQSLIDALLRG